MTYRMSGAEKHLEFTPAQSRMWAGQKMLPDAPLYNMALSYRILGPLQPERFTAAFAKLVEEADALRMVVVEAGEAPSQRVHAVIDPALAFIDLQAEADPANAAQTWMEARSQISFDLTERSFDSALLRLGREDWIWYYNQHHLFTDASSFAVLFRRLEALYQEVDGAPLPAFADHIALGSATAQTESAEAHFSARQGQNAPLYNRRPGMDASASVRLEVPFPDDLAAAFTARTKERGWAALTPQMSQYMMLATVLFAYLNRVTGQTRQSIGAPVHNRATPSAKQTAGLLIDVLPMQVEVSEGETFASLFGKVRQETGLFLRHSNAGVSGSGYHRAFNTVLNFITAQFGSFAGMETHSAWLHPGHCDPNHVLRLQVEDFNQSGRPRLFLDLNTDVFPDPSLGVAHFSAMLRAFLEEPDQAIDAVEIAGGAERAQLLSFAQADPAPQERRFIPDLIAAQAAAIPTAPALVFSNETLSYADMWSRVEALVTALQQQGVRKGDRVALVLPRSPAAVIAMIAAMRAGAAYIPIDPNVPKARIAMIVADAACQVVVATQELAEHLETATLTLGEDGTLAQPIDPDPAPVALDPADTAYVLYTSGSTGKPKGVIVPHRGLSHYVGWARDTYCANGPLTFPLFSPLTFDLTVTSLFVPLVSGGTLRIYPEPSSGPDLAILDVVSENAVDIIKLTPSHLRLQAGREMKDTRVRQLIVGGEDLTAALAHEAYQAFGENVAIHNEYGPTEATVGCVLHSFDPASDVVGSLPIGRPITNMGAFVRSSAGALQPVGVAGELWLTGAGIADGYHNRPEASAAAFVTDPDGIAAYRTGDLARLRPDGVIEYLGRIDAQVKVNGVRIETGEIETTLTRHSGVDAACVILHSPAAKQSHTQQCVRCGLPSNFPSLRFTAAGLCSICCDYDRIRDAAQSYFEDMPALQAVLDRRLPHEGTHDALVLFSGGKDSSYMLGRLADMGLRILAFTLDNGFISAQAKANISRVVDALGVDHVFGEVPEMNAIFADSLKRHANVCNGCFKAIYTLSMSMALERKIPFIFTGLSRGQFFETRLSAELFESGAPRIAEIDQMVLEARKTYHRTPDAVSACMDTRVFQTDEIFEKVEIVDFYRYCDVDLDDLYAYLDTRLPWVRPSDTGRSTNCRVNDVGIHVHKTERGYHNYALPYSWDVRMGHKKRDAALEELDDEYDVAEVEAMMAEIGYSIKAPEAPQPELVAYYAGPTPLKPQDLRAHMKAALPGYMVPAQYVHLAEMPLSRNGKIDKSALPEPPARSPTSDARVAPRNNTEAKMAAIWADVLGADEIGVTDDFFDLGGDSISALRIHSRARRAGFDLRPDDIFEALTVEALCALAATRKRSVEGQVAPGPVALLPAQRWFFQGHRSMPPAEAQVLKLRGLNADEPTLETAFAKLIAHHDALRTAFRYSDEGWQAEILASGAAPAIGYANDPASAQPTMLRALDPARGQHIAVALLSGGDTLIAVHHLVIDALSWPILIEDLRAAIEGQALPRKTSSVRAWANQLPNVETAGIAEALPDNLRAPEGALASDLAHRRTDIPAQTIARLRTGLRAKGATLQDGLLAALSLSFAGQGSARLAVDVESIGRAEPSGTLDASRTIGWFTEFVPRWLAIPADATDPLAALGDTLRAKPALDSRPSIVFNLIDATELETGDTDSQGPLDLWRAPDAPLRHILAINLALTAEGLAVTWSYPGDKAALEDCAQRFERAVAGLLQALPQARARKRGATDQANLNKLAALMAKSGAK